MRESGGGRGVKGWRERSVVWAWRRVVEEEV